MGKRPLTRVIALGSAESMEADLAAAAELGVVPGQRGWVLVACNQAGKLWPGAVDHWCSYHGELLPKWIMERGRAGLPPAGEMWTGERRAIPKGLEVRRAPNWGGSSGLLCVSVALHLGATRVVCCGIPLDVHQGHFTSPGKKWRDGGNYRHGWTNHLDRLKANVRSMSGWTRDLLGAPDREWLYGKPSDEDAGAGRRDGGGGAGRDGDGRPARPPA